jgi:NADP-dependent 3-hydroxy acid dehydrogenase YdfG
MKIQDTVTVITGACSDIGWALAMELARREPHGLALVDRDESVKEIAGAVNQMAGDWISFSFIGDENDCKFRKKVYQEIAERCGMANICVPVSPNGASTPRRSPVEANRMAPVLWALEMVRGIGKRLQGQRDCWNSTASLNGMVFFIRPISLTRNKRGNQIMAAEWKRAAVSLMRQADLCGVRCAVMLPDESERELRPSSVTATRKDSWRAIGGPAQPEALAKAICFMISDYADPKPASESA